jgi:hypothetical protein
MGFIASNDNSDGFVVILKVHYKRYYGPEILFSVVFYSYVSINCWNYPFY